MTKTIHQKVAAAADAAASQNPNGKFQTADVMVFDNPEFGHIRLLLGENGEPLFCGKDVCEVLGYRRTDNAIRQHVNTHDALKQCVSTPIVCHGHDIGKCKRMQMLFVNESGFYSLVFGSKLPIAEQFKLWVTSVVLPQIRKTGGYIPIRKGDTDEDAVRNAERILRKTLQEKDSFIAGQQKLIREQAALLDGKRRLIAEQETEIDRLLPKALYADNVLDSVSCYTTTQVAKELELTAQEQNRWLCAERIQYYQSGQYMLYADYAHRGLAKSRTHFDLFAGRDTVHTRMYLVWTEKGRKFIHERVERSFLGS